jgi:hypothetical protein
MAIERVPSLMRTILLATAAVLSFCTHWRLMAEDSILDRPVKSFYSSNESAFDAILRFGSENKIPIGLVFTHRLCSTRIRQLSIEHTSARIALQELAREVPSYSWKLDDDTAIFVPDDIPAATSTFLALRVSNYSISEETLQAQVVYVWMDIKSSLRPSEGTAFNILSSPKWVKWPSLTLNNLNVEQVLDHLIARKAGGIWILLSLDDLDKAADKRPFWVIGYSDDPQGQAAASCTYIEAEEPK